MSFFGPGGLSGGGSQSGLDPQLLQALVKQFPGLSSLGGSQTPPNNLSTMGYSYPGVTLYQGQGTGSFGNALSPFESAGGVSPESITGGLAMGSFGKSSSQQPGSQGSMGGGFGNLSLPSLNLPMAQVAASQAGAADESGLGGAGSGGGAPAGNGGIGVGDILGAGQKAAGLFGGQDLGTQPTTPGLPQQRADERTDYTNATGSPSGIPQPVSQPNWNAVGTAAPGAALSPNDLEWLQSLNAPPQLGNPTFRPQPLPDASMPNLNDVLGGVNGDTSMAAPGGSAQFSLGGPNANYLGAGQSAFGALSGGLNLFGGIQSGDPLAASMGGLQTIGGVAGLLQNLPSLADKLGLSGGALNGVGGAVSGIGGAYSLYQGIQSGDPMQIAGGLTSLYGGASSLVNEVAGTELMPALTDLAIQAVSAVSPAAAQAISQAISTVGTTVGTFAGPIAAVVTAILDSMAEMDRERVQNAGFTNNPIKGALYSGATEGVGNILKALDQLQASGGMGQANTVDLGSQLASALNNMMPYYATAEGGRDAIRASDTITGRGASSSSKAYTGGQSPAEYTQNFTNAQQGVAQMIQELMNRGATYEDLGNLPGVSGGWTQQSLDAGNQLYDMYALNPGKFDTEAQPLLQQLASYGRYQLDPQEAAHMAAQGLNPATFGYTQDTQGNWSGSRWGNVTPADLFLAAQGQAALKADRPGDSQSGLITNMYGGPLWAALSRSGTGGPEIQNLIAQHFDPWAVIRNFTPAQLAGAVRPNMDMAAAGVQATGVQPPLYAPSEPGLRPFWQQALDARTAQDPYTQALQQFQQQLGQLQGQLPQIGQAAQQVGTQGLDPGVLAALQGAPGFSGGNGQFSPTGGTGGGGMDLAALLQQLGYAPQGQPVAA